MKVAASPGVWIVISKLQESLAEHSSVLHANVQPVILNPSRELQVVHVIDRSSCLLLSTRAPASLLSGPKIKLWAAFCLKFLNLLHESALNFYYIEASRSPIRQYALPCYFRSDGVSSCKFCFCDWNRILRDFIFQ